MAHRRRGADYTQVFQTFHNANSGDCRSVLESITREARSSTEINTETSSVDKTYDDDNRINSKTLNRDGTSASGSFKSMILAGQAAKSESQRTSESSYRTAKSESEAERIRSTDASLVSSQQSEVPSIMNKAIPLEFSPRPELDLSQTTDRSEKSRIDGRDTNHNIKGGLKEFPGTSNKHEFCQGLQSPRHKFQPSASRARGAEHKDTWSILSSLDNVLDPSGDKTAKSHKKILKRLSQEFLYSPRTFTERLVTIIDESETGYVCDEASGVNLSRMTKEFRKMCKFIQDESMPEMAPSLCMNSILGTSRYPDDNKLTNTERPATIMESPTESPSIDCKTPPPEQNVNAKKIYRKTPLNIFKNTYREKRGAGSPHSPGSPNSTRDFEYWEKHCEGLPNSPKSMARDRPKPLRRSLSTSDISKESKEKLMLRCEELLRSLDDTNPAEFETFDSHRGQGAPDREIEQPSSNIRDGPHVTKDGTCVNQSCAKYEEDELSKSLMIEKELQRQRCFETALLMQEIEEDAKKTKEEYPKALERHGIDVGTAFMKTIATCMAYQNSLSGMRQSSHLKRKEGSSVDSGIDVRSFGRTLYASSKKSCNEASVRNSQKQNRNYGLTAKGQRSGEMSSIRSNSARLAIKKTDRKATSADNLYRGDTNRVEKRNAAVSPRRNAAFLRPNTKSLTQSKPPSREIRSPKLQIPSKIPSRKFLTASPRPSPSTKNLSKERIPKMANYQTVKREKSPVLANTPRSPRNRFFVTPGRNIPTKTKTNTKTYFPNLDDAIRAKGSQCIMKSLHAPGLYRLGYKTVISPIGMYIRGTDVNLIHNNHERKNEMMLTPTKVATSEEKLKFKLASKTSTPRDSPRRKNRLFIDKEGSESDDNNENIPEPGFLLPKANYNQPAQVHTVNESPTLIRGARTRGLLQSMQNRVVIRHEGKSPGIYKDNEVPESYNDSLTDMSIHVLKSAEKTNFMSRRNI